MKMYSKLQKQDIVIGNKYWTCSWSGRICVTVLKIFKDTDCVLVMTGGKKAKPFVRQIKFVFTDEEECKRAGKQWEHDEKLRKKNK